MDSNNKPVSRVPASLRPEGFQAAPAVKKAPAVKPDSSAKPEKKSGRIKAKKSVTRRVQNKPDRPKKPVIKKPRKKADPGLIRFMVVVILAIVLVTSAIIVIVNSGRTVHQMPTILRITEEPTMEPEMPQE